MVWEVVARSLPGPAVKLLRQVGPCLPPGFSRGLHVPRLCCGDLRLGPAGGTGSSCGCWPDVFQEVLGRRSCRTGFPAGTSGRGGLWKRRCQVLCFHAVGLVSVEMLLKPERFPEALGSRARRLHSASGRQRSPLGKSPRELPLSFSCPRWSKERVLKWVIWW